ncbi:MAG TPA: hypothetical protein DEP88_00570 [Verrucomicrobiales bacterium]|nr:hypothetical protein [Verrucomicrobiales bacterium]
MSDNSSQPNNDAAHKTEQKTSIPDAKPRADSVAAEAVETSAIESDTGKQSNDQGHKLRSKKSTGKKSAKKVAKKTAKKESKSDSPGERNQDKGQGNKATRDDSSSHSQPRRGRTRGKGRQQQEAATEPKVKLSRKLIAKRAWKIFVGEVTEEGLALITDKDARELSRRSMRVAEIYSREEAVSLAKERAEKKTPKVEKNSHKEEKSKQEEVRAEKG